MLNRVMLLGRLTKEPEMRSTGTGKAVATFTIAVQRRFVQKDSATNADFFSITAWDKLADFVCNYYHKGQQVLVSGKLENRSWIDKDGNRRYATDIVIDETYFADGKKYKQENLKDDSKEDSISDDFEPVETNTSKDDLPF